MTVAIGRGYTLIAVLLVFGFYGLLRPGEIIALLGQDVTFTMTSRGPVTILAIRSPNFIFAVVKEGVFLSGEAIH